MLYQVLYSSTLVIPFGTRAMRGLLAQARRHNAACGISGVLLHYPDICEVVQVLEGDKAVVLALLARIEADPRHCNLALHYEAAIDRRNLGAWPMGFLSAQTDVSPTHAASADDGGHAALRLQGNAAVGMRLLRILRAGVPPGASVH